MTASTDQASVADIAAEAREKLAPLVARFAQADTQSGPADTTASGGAGANDIPSDAALATALARGEDRIAAVEELREGHEDQVELVRKFQAALFETGLAFPSGPPALGGRGLTVDHDAAVESVIDELGFPSREALFVGLNIVSPALVAHADAALRDWSVPALFRGEIVGCQLFSEPGAGSDLADAQTKAVRDGDDWILTGQKVWTSMGHIADVGEALVRTDPSASKHAGLTMFLVDMDSRGVTVRPIRQMTGGAAFNEVFLDEVRVPDSRRIGDLSEGWKVANTSLGSERGGMSGSAGPITPFVLARLVHLVQRTRAAEDPVVRPRIASATAALTALRAVPGLSDASWSHTQAPVAASVAKMLMVRALDEIRELADAALGSDAYTDSTEPDTYAWSEFTLGVQALHIAGGTDEIQHNVIAQRGLGLPRPPKAK